MKILFSKKIPKGYTLVLDDFDGHLTNKNGEETDFVALPKILFDAIEQYAKARANEKVEEFKQTLLSLIGIRSN